MTTAGARCLYLIERHRDDDVAGESVVTDDGGLWHVDPKGRRSGPFTSIEDAFAAHPSLLAVGEVDRAEVTTELVDDRTLANRFDSPAYPYEDESPVTARPGILGVEMFDLALFINGHAWYATADGIRFFEGCDERTVLDLYWEDESRLDPGDTESLHRWENVWFYAGSDAENHSTDRIWVDDRSEHDVALDCLKDADVWFFAEHRPPTLHVLEITCDVLDEPAIADLLDGKPVAESTEISVNGGSWTCESGSWQLHRGD